MKSIDAQSRVWTGFTLLELLIVIAIILILIAIALPNFLQAQIRARVTRVRSEIRTVATALESYQTDWRDYPWAAALSNLGAPALPPAEPADLFLSFALTTPVSYLSLLPEDTFNQTLEESGNGLLIVPFHYAEEETNGRLGQPDLIRDLLLLLIQQTQRSAYYVLSHGPDGDHEELGGHHHELSDHGEEEDEGGPSIYAPTNGTTSNGDIFYFGSGLGFISG